MFIKQIGRKKRTTKNQQPSASQEAKNVAWQQKENLYYSATKVVCLCNKMGAVLEKDLKQTFIAFGYPNVLLYRELMKNRMQVGALHETVTRIYAIGHFSLPFVLVGI